MEFRKILRTFRLSAGTQADEDAAVASLFEEAGEAIQESPSAATEQNIEGRRAGVQLALLVLERWAVLRQGGDEGSIGPDAAELMRDTAEAAFAFIGVYHWEEADITKACETLAVGWFGRDLWRWEDPETQEVILNAAGDKLLDMTQEWPEPRATAVKEPMPGHGGEDSESEVSE